MASTASHIIIDQWVTVVSVAPDATPAAPLQLPAPNHERLYAADVQARAAELYGPLPYYLSKDQRREIAEQLDAQAEQRRADRLRKCSTAAQYYCDDSGYGPASQAYCTPSQSNTITGRG